VEAKVEAMEKIWLVAPPTKSRVAALHPEGVHSMRLKGETALAARAFIEGRAPKA
jgi:hypothetical protein